MERRLKLSEFLHNFCDNVYFQPPENIQMAYPAIVYSPDSENRMHANNDTYDIKDRYQVTIIDSNPDSPIRMAFRRSPFCSFSRSFRTDGLNHFIYSLYY